MKRTITLLTIVITSLTTWGQNNTTTATVKKEEVVINHAMIEKFNATEYSEDIIPYHDLLKNYQFDDVRLIVSAYKAGRINFSDKEIVEKELLAIKKEIEEESLKLKLLGEHEELVLNQ